MRSVALALVRGALVTVQVKATSFLGNVIGAKTSTEVDPIGSYIGWVYAAASKRAKRVAAAEMHLYQLGRKGDITEVFDHDFLTLLYKPNAWQDRYQFFYTIEMFLCLWGEAPVHIERAGGAGGRIVNLYPLRPDLLQKIRAMDNSVTGYRYNVGGTTKNFTLEEVAMLKEPSPFSIYDGFGAVRAAAQEIDTDIAAAAWNKHLLENMAEPGSVLQTDKKLDESVAKRILKAWKKRHGGPTNAGTTSILDAGLKWQATGRSPEEMQLHDMRNFSRNTIVPILGVPVGLMTSEDVNLANAEVAERVFSRDTIEPELRLIYGQINETVTPLFDESLWLDFESEIAENVQENINIVGAGKDTFLSVNEMRAMFDKPLIDSPEADAIWKPIGVIPAIDGQPVNPSKQYERIQVKRPETGAKRMVGIKARILARTHFKRKVVEGTTDKAMSKILGLMAKHKTQVIRVKVKGVGEPAPAAHKHGPRIEADRLEFLAKLPMHQQEMKLAVKHFFTEQEKEVLANLKDAEIPKGAKVNFGPWVEKILFAKAASDKLLVEITGKYIKDNIKVGSAAIRKLLGTGQGDILNIPHVFDYLEKRAAAAIAVNEYTRDKIRASIAEGLNAGEDLGGIRDRITNVYKQAQGFRAETIARTEVGAAQNYGRTEEMKQQHVERKTWVCIFSNSREAHMEADGQVRAVGDTFDVGGEPLAFPGDPAGSAENVINCQCSAVPTLDDITP